MLKLADLMFTYDPNDPISMGIGAFLYPVQFKGKDVDWSHVHGISHIKYPGVFDVISADGLGVVEKEVSLQELDRHDVRYAFLTHPGPNLYARNGIVITARTQVGRMYDFQGLGSFILGKDINDPQKWFCSELWAWAYNMAWYPLVRRVKTAWTHPNLLWTSTILEETEP